MSDLTDIRDPLIRPKKSTGAVVGLGIVGLAGSFVGQILLGALLITLAPYCAMAPLEEEIEDIIEMAIVEEPEPLVEEPEEVVEEVEEEKEIEEKEEKVEEKVEEKEEELEEIETDKEEVKEEAAPPEILEALTIESFGEDGFKMKVGAGIKSGKVNNTYIDPKNLNKIKTKEGGQGDGFIKKKPTKKCKDRDATVKKRVKGEYPLQAQRRRLEGSVTAIVTVSPLGKVVDVMIIKGPGHGFNESADKAFRRWRFKPAEKNCIRVQDDVRVTHTFTLE